MCKPASFVMTKDQVFWCKKNDSHEGIIHEHNLHADGVGGPNIVRVEIAPPKGNLSLPLSKWQYKVDQDTTPDWYDTDREEKRVRLVLKDWRKEKLTGWNVKEAFSPVNPLLIKRKRMSKQKMKGLLKELASVGASVRDSVRDSVGDSVGDSMRDSVRDSVGDSVWASVGASMWDSVGASVGDSVGDSMWAYIGGLFTPRITEWKYVEKLGPNPWKPLLELWYAGYVPSFDGTTWRLHAGKKAQVVFEISKEELSK